MAVKIAEIPDIRGLREALGLSQEAMARLLGVSVRTVSRWECGGSEPHPLALRELRRWQRLLERLNDVFKTTAIPRWFNRPNKALAAGFEALKVPSVTSQGNNLVIFLENLSEGAKLEVTESRPVAF